MEFEKLLQTRRSIRKYDESKKITEDQLKEIVRAGIQAPSWKNTETARYYGVLSDDMIEKVRECLPVFNQKNSAGRSLLVTSYVKGQSGYGNGRPANELADGWGLYDLGLANQNIVMKAADMGLATLIMGIRDADKLAELLNVPENEVIVSVIAMGYPATEPANVKRKTADDILKIF